MCPSGSGTADEHPIISGRPYRRAHQWCACLVPEQILWLRNEGVSYKVETRVNPKVKQNKYRTAPYPDPIDRMCGIVTAKRFLVVVADEHINELL
jgi:hypothetical protein